MELDSYRVDVRYDHITGPEWMPQKKVDGVWYNMKRAPFPSYRLAEDCIDKEKEDVTED